MRPPQPTGIDLSHRFYTDVVRPILDERFAGMPHAAGRLGAGSDVLGLDDERSRDHDWGLRLSLFVPGDEVPAVDDALARLLPETFAGLETRYAFTGQAEARHHVDVSTVRGFAASRLGFDPLDGISVREWLSLTGQAALEVTAGPVFADGPGELTRARAALEWYPDDMWRYVLAADWARLAQELPLMGRAGEVGDDRGSQLIAARLAQIAIHLAFLLERRWPPYAKWFGTLFAGLPLATEVGPALDGVLRAETWQERQTAFADALQPLLVRQNGLGLTEVERAVIPFWDRPHVHPDPAIVEQLLRGVVDPEVRALPLGRGSIEQRTDNVDVLMHPAARLAAVADEG